MKRVLPSLMVLAIFVACAAQMKSISWDLKPASRAGYGYTAEDPICIGYSKDLAENVGLSTTYMQRLRASDQQPLQIVARFTVQDPRHEPEQPKFLGLPLRNGFPKGGLLDAYILVSVQGTDTVRLYFDIYHKDSLRVPTGLQWISPASAQ